MLWCVILFSFCRTFCFHCVVLLNKRANEIYKYGTKFSGVGEGGEYHKECLCVLLKTKRNALYAVKSY